MERRQIIIKGNFKGLLPNFMKSLLLVISGIISFFIGNILINNLSKANTELSVIEHILDISDIGTFLTFLFACLLFIIAVLFIIYSIINLITTLYEFSRVTIFDFEKNTISVKHLYFPFIKIDELHSISSLCEVTTCKSILQNAFHCGDLYIEFFAHTSPTDQIKKMYIPYIYNVDKLKSILSSKL